MISKAIFRYVRISPRKIRYCIDLVRRKPVPSALSILDHSHRGAALMVKKLLLTASASAKKQHETAPEDLVVSKITADGAGAMKRWRAMTMGRAGMIRKRMSHVVVELERAKGAPKAKARVQPSKKKKLVGAK
jgi:large subunit ribosomal protein L22